MRSYFSFRKCLKKSIRFAATATVASIGLGFACDLTSTSRCPLLTMCEGTMREGPAKATFVPVVYTIRKPLVVMVNKERSFHAASWVADVEGLVPFESAASFVYDGPTVNGKLHGRGRLTSWTGMTYEGEFENGVIVKGTVTVGDGFTYEGAFDANWTPHGVGKLHHRDGYFEGTFVHGVFPNIFKNHMHNDTLIMEVTVDPKKWNNTRNYTLRGYSLLDTKMFELTGSYPCKCDAWEGNLVYTHPFGAVSSERGNFTRSFLTFSGKPKLMLHGAGVRWYREGAIEQGQFQMGKLGRQFGDFPGIMVRALGEWAAMKIHGR